jgi:hypothetical protein
MNYDKKKMFYICQLSEFFIICPDFLLFPLCFLLIFDSFPSFVTHLHCFVECFYWF